MEILRKVQKLPEGKRKIIFWLLLIIIGVGLVSFFIRNTQKRFENFEGGDLKEDLQLPKLEEELDNLPELPNFEMPELIPKEDEEKLKELEELIKEAEEQEKIEE